MNATEMIECGQLMQAHAAGTTSPEQVTRMKQLMARAKVELPHDDPNTPGIDEGETEIMREIRIKGEWQDRLIAVEKTLLRIGEALAGAAAAELPELLLGAIKKR